MPIVKEFHPFANHSKICGITALYRGHSKWSYGMLQNQKDKNREDKTGFQNKWERSKVQGILIDKNPNQEITNKVDTEGMRFRRS